MNEVRRVFRAWSIGVVLGCASIVASPPCFAACPADTAANRYAHARQAFEDKRFDESIALLREAYACEKNPLYLANVARVLEEAKRPREALDAWRAYRDVLSDSGERSQAQGRISALSKIVEDLDRLEREKHEAEAARIRAEEEVRAKRGASSPSPSPPQPAFPVGPVVVAGIGATGIATGLVLGILAGSKHDSAVTERDVNRAESIQSDAKAFATGANIALIAGGVVAAGGLVWLALSLPTRGASARAGGALVLSGSGVALSGAF